MTTEGERDAGPVGDRSGPRRGADHQAGTPGEPRRPAPSSTLPGHHHEEVASSTRCGRERPLAAATSGSARVSIKRAETPATTATAARCPRSASGSTSELAHPRIPPRTAASRISGRVLGALNPRNARRGRASGRVRARSRRRCGPRGPASEPSAPIPSAPPSRTRQAPEDVARPEKAAPLRRRRTRRSGCACAGKSGREARRRSRPCPPRSATMVATSQVFHIRPVNIRPPGAESTTRPPRPPT